LALATFMPSRVRMLIRSASNSATIASTLNSSRPTGSVGSYTEPPRLSLTCRTVSSSAMALPDGLPLGQEFPRGGQLWQKLRRAIDLRDRCIHPKPPFPHENDQTAADAEFVITTVTAVLSKVSELMGVEPQRWWGPADRLVDSLDDADMPIIDLPPRP
jgi:hypothetical protein